MAGAGDAAWADLIPSAGSRGVSTRCPEGRCSRGCGSCWCIPGRIPTLGPAASPSPGGPGLGVSDPSPIFFQALLQKRSMSAITTWSSSPLCHVGRRTGEDFHPPRAQTSPRAVGDHLHGVTTSAGARARRCCGKGRAEPRAPNGCSLKYPSSLSA